MLQLDVVFTLFASYCAALSRVDPAKDLMVQAWRALYLRRRLPAILFLIVTWTECVCPGLVTFPASLFQHHWTDVGATALAYNGIPLAQISGQRRGKVLEKWVRQVLQERDPNRVIEDAVPGNRSNGAQRSPCQTKIDFLDDGRKVEVKSSRLRFHENRSRWELNFQNIKLQLSIFDDLYLVLFSPKWFHLVKHDLRTGISRNGNMTNTRGYVLRLCGRKHQSCEESVDFILNKLCVLGNCELIETTPVSNIFIADLYAQNADYDYTRQFYHGKPFSCMQPQLRGRRVEAMLREVDERRNLGSDFSRSRDELTCSGSKRGPHMASVDWLRDDIRVEAKCSQLQYSPSKNLWFCLFVNVKPDCFDELHLAIYSPRGLDIFMHDGIYGLSAGENAKAVSVWAPTGEEDPLSALQSMENKLEANGCPKIASIPWDP